MLTETTRFVAISLLFHLLYTYSIFDIYFTSPVVHPSRRFSAHTALEQSIGREKEAYRAPAERLVLIVGDGLRADTLYKYHESTLLPPWAREDILQHGVLRPITALSTTKDWTWTGESRNDTFTFDAAPYLRQIALQRGRWGLSHTRVPTESRPGHVALIAGMYEDVSAVTKGWKLNPVPFDSVFNQSSHTFSFGSPDILPMFAKGATPGKVDMESYREEAEDFTADASNLDLWVLQRLDALLSRARENTTLESQLKSPGTVIFLHLLGLDTTGHTYKPKSSEYIGNLMTVNAIVADAERMISDYFDDNKTAYIFTADHGMSNKGNHGDGEPDNTRTPLVAWGAGIKQPASRGESEQRWRSVEQEKDSYYSNWGQLDHSWRDDVAQADISTLMAALLGIDMPANSEGVLPLAYLDAAVAEAASCSFANARAILETFRVKDSDRRARMIRYMPFTELSSEGDDPPGTNLVKTIDLQISQGKYEAALQSCRELIDRSLRGAQYLQTYDWMLLISIVFTGYLGSIIYGFAFLLRHYVLSQDDLARKCSKIFSSTQANILIGSVLLIFFSKFMMERAAVTYYMYTAFAAFYWIRILEEADVFVLAGKAAAQAAGSSSQKVTLSIAIRIVLSLIALEVMVFGYLHRFAWTAGFVFIGFVWPAIGIPGGVKTRHEPLIILWTVLCATCGAFTLNSVEKEESVPFLVGSGLLFLLAGSSIVLQPSFFFPTGENEDRAKTLHRTISLLKKLLLILVVTTAVTASSSIQLQQKKGLPLVNQVLAWFSLCFCITTPFTHLLRSKRTSGQSQQTAPHRLLVIIFSFAPVFVLLSIRDEALFFGCYSLMLLLWAKLEGALYEERKYADFIDSGRQARLSPGGRGLEKEDVRIAIFFLFFLHVGFFGTGNIASISSFYLSPVYRLVPIFSPFLMAALLLLKILTPFVILSSVFQLVCITRPHARITHAVERKTGLQIAGPPLFGVDSVGGLGLKDAYSLVLLACISTDVLAISFLVAVKTQGSWLEIGQSITHFAMANLLQVFMLGLGSVADAIVGRGDVQVKSGR